eukprot:TRINITY_DN29182_c0_g1_i1.p1 TRINITY_DN29182_c0_g1~~TRINITY_DN29182_c0_g1_i1.p1  ORF type:complete len:879 (+),score=398.09 TRINITY_DN29182_c0_g1_i1:60-2696(+)
MTRVLLPSNVVPHEYDLTLEPDMEKFMFKGSVEIKVTVAEKTKVVEMHQRDLCVSAAVCKCAEGAKLEAVAVTTRNKDKTLSLEFDEEIPVGEATLALEFTGVLNDQLAGFYRSKYTGRDGTTKHMATTQFEAIDARRCFPCWDEPARKAVFNLTLVCPEHLMAISNMPEKSCVGLEGGRKRVAFLPTPKMSTYLLAFCIGEFDFIQGQTKNGTLIRVLSVPGKSKDLAFALDTGIKALEFYNDFFGIPYPLPKLDMIAIPDFAAGAMENWGLVTYREVDLIIDPAKASSSQKQRVAIVITHELAHQWFGNLVTMAWWDDLWLNEGFANWMQTFTADSIFPEWCIWESFVTNEQTSALRLDALRSSHPILVPIARAESVEEVFDLISYCKGGSVIRMIYSLLGRETFRQGLVDYLQTHSYSNTESTDLWAAWDKASGQPIRELMDTWILQMGYPLITVSNVSKKDGKLKFDVEQKWYLADGSVKEGDADKKWIVPLIFGTQEGAHPPQYLREKKQTVELETAGSWVKVNYGQHIPLRVKYPTEMLEELCKAVSGLPAEDRIGLLSDADSLSKSEDLSLADFVRVLNSYKGEMNDKVWSQLSQALAGLKGTLYGTTMPNKAEIKAKMDKLISDLVKPVVEAVGWDGRPDDTDNLKKLRAIVLGQHLAVNSKEPEVVREATERIAAYKEDKNTAKLNPDIRASLMKVLVKNNGAAAIEELKALHNDKAESPFRNDVYTALGVAQDEGLLMDAMLWALDGKDVRSQDFVYVQRAVSAAVVSNEVVGGRVMQAFIEAHYDEVFNLIGNVSAMMFASILKSCFSGITTREELEKMKNFWEAKKLTHLEKALGQSIEAVDNRIKAAEAFAASELATAAFWDNLN